jgi:hypothetical protein
MLARDQSVIAPPKDVSGVIRLDAQFQRVPLGGTVWKMSPPNDYKHYYLYCTVCKELVRVESAVNKLKTRPGPFETTPYHDCSGQTRLAFPRRLAPVEGDGAFGDGRQRAVPLTAQAGTLEEARAVAKAAVTKLALETNLPVSVVCGGGFGEFLLQWGELARENLHLPLTALLPPGREYVAAEAIRLGEESRQRFISEMTRRPYVALVGDGVSKGASKFYVMLLGRAGGGDLSSYPFHVASGFEGRGIDHAERFLAATRAVIGTLCSDGLPMELVGATVDGCSAQQNALDSNHRDFFMDAAVRAQAGAGFSSQLCACHGMQTVILHLRRKCPVVNDMYNVTKELADFLNTRYVRRILEGLGLPVCPLNVKTRWTDMLRTVTYALKYTVEIASVIKQVAEQQMERAVGRPPATVALDAGRVRRFAQRLITPAPEHVIVITPFLVTSISMGADDASCGDVVCAVLEAATEARLLGQEFGLDQLHPEALDAISALFEDLINTWLDCNPSVRNAFATSVTARGREMLNELASASVTLPTLHGQHLSGLRESLSYIQDPGWPDKVEAARAHIEEIARYFEPARRAGPTDGRGECDSDGCVEIDGALAEEELEEIEARDVPDDEAERLTAIEQETAGHDVWETVPFRVVRQREIPRDAVTRHAERAALLPPTVGADFYRRAKAEMCDYAAILEQNPAFMARASHVFGAAFVPMALGRDSLKRQFDFWLSPNSEVHGLPLPEEVLAAGTHEAVWSGVQEWCVGLSGLSMLAQRVLTVMASEAPVERLNNKLKRALGDYARRMSDETLLARLRLMHDRARPGGATRHVTRDP